MPQPPHGTGCTDYGSALQTDRKSGMGRTPTPPVVPPCQCHSTSGHWPTEPSPMGNHWQQASQQPLIYSTTAACDTAEPLPPAQQLTAHCKGQGSQQSVHANQTALPRFRYSTGCLHTTPHMSWAPQHCSTAGCMLDRCCWPGRQHQSPDCYLRSVLSELTGTAHQGRTQGTNG
jgi:hypothetical protein